MTVVRPADLVEVAEPSNQLVLTGLVTAAAHGPDLSVTRVRIDGRHRRLLTRRSTRVYVVLDGELRMRVGDEAAETVLAGDVVVIPRGRPYDLAGRATYLVINGPAFQDGDDEYTGEAGDEQEDDR